MPPAVQQLLPAVRLLLSVALLHAPVGCGEAGSAVLCDHHIDAARRCDWCAEKVDAHRACVQSNAEALSLLGGPHSGTRREACRHGTFEYSVFDVFVGRSLALYGEWSEPEWADIAEPALRHAGAGAVGFDIGANLGAFMVPMAKAACGLGGRVVAIEADDANFALLEANAALNIPPGAAVGCLTLVHAVGGAFPRPATAVPDLALSAARQQPHRLRNFGNPDDAGGSDLPQNLGHIVTTTVDEIMQRPSLNLTRCDYIKIDVEGAELDVLKGATRTLRSRRPVVYVENDRFSTAVLEELSLRHGYVCAWHTPPLFSPKNWKREAQAVFTEESANLLCYHPSQRVQLGWLPSWAVTAAVVTAKNQRSTLAQARLSQNLAHYDQLGAAGSGRGRWWLNGAELLQGVISVIGRAAGGEAAWGAHHNGALERIERYLQRHKEGGSTGVNGGLQEELETKEEEEEERLMWALNQQAVLLKAHAKTIATAANGDQTAAIALHQKAVGALRRAVGLAITEEQRRPLAANLGGALTSAGDTEAALQHYNSLLAAAEGSAESPSLRIPKTVELQELYEGKGWTLQLAERYTEAAEAYRQSAQPWLEQPLPAKPKTLVSLGVCQARLGRMAESLLSFEAAAELGEESGRKNAATIRAAIAQQQSRPGDGQHEKEL